MLIVLSVTAGGVLGGIVGSVIATPVLAAVSGAFGFLRERHTDRSGGRSSARESTAVT